MSAKDLGPLDWRTPIVSADGRPTPEFQRRWNTQRQNNALIGTITFGTGAPTGVPDDGAEYVDISGTPYVLYVGNSGAWHKAGVTKFIELADVPHAYTGAGNKIVRVNAGATALEFVTQSAELDTIDSTANHLLLRGVSGWAGATVSQVLDVIGSTRGMILYRGASGWAVLSPGTSGQFLQTQGAGADPQWAAGGGGGLPNVPLLSQFNVGNAPAGSARFDSPTGLVMTCPSVGLIMHALEYKTAPGATFTLTATGKSAWSGNNTGVGVFVRDAAGKVAQFGFSPASGQIGNLNYWNSYTSFNANVTNVSGPGPFSGYKLVYTGTTFNFSAGSEANGTVQRISVSSTAFIGAPTAVGLYQYLLSDAQATTWTYFLLGP